MKTSLLFFLLFWCQQTYPASVNSCYFKLDHNNYQVLYNGPKYFATDMCRAINKRLDNIIKNVALKNSHQRQFQEILEFDAYNISIQFQEVNSDNFKKGQFLITIFE